MTLLTTIKTDKRHAAVQRFASPRTGSTIDILGVAVSDLPRMDALSFLHARFDEPAYTKVAFLNAHGANIAMRDDAFRAALSGFLVLPDGIGVDIAAQWLEGRRFAANLNGTDFVPALIESAPRALRIGLLGGAPGVAEQAAAALARLSPRHCFRVIAHGFAAEPDIAAALACLSEEPVDLLLVALGNPKQEMFIARCTGPQHARVAMGVGALFDFLAGVVPRAPEWLRRARLEWLYRLAQEPKRLFRRYVLGNPAFLLRVLRHKFLRRGADG